MEKTTDIETKYQKLATEYSKVRSQATVLKKAVLDEQGKNIQLNETIKKFEQKIRKHDQEMESLTFRNEQLTKRISVLQQELQINSHGKKNKARAVEGTPSNSDISVLNEELQKKIIENAQLSSSMSDKEFELSECGEKIEWLEKRLEELQLNLEKSENRNRQEVEKLKNDKIMLQKKMNELSLEKPISNGEISSCDKINKYEEDIKFWKEESDRWKTECEVLRSRPNTNEQLTEYYEKQITELVETKSIALSETQSLLAENLALNARLESLILDLNSLETASNKNIEELTTSNDNYKAQLDALTEHLAAQNEKITKQCDEIEILRHNLSLRK